MSLRDFLRQKPIGIELERIGPYFRVPMANDDAQDDGAALRQHLLAQGDVARQLPDEDRAHRKQPHRLLDHPLHQLEIGQVLVGDGPVRPDHVDDLLVDALLDVLEHAQHHEDEAVHRGRRVAALRVARIGIFVGGRLGKGVTYGYHEGLDLFPELLVVELGALLRQLYELLQERLSLRF